MKLLYAMHVNWHWIRQRPHVLAEQLAQRHRVELLHFKMYRRSHRAAEAPPPFPARELLRIPEQLKRLGRPLQVAECRVVGKAGGLGRADFPARCAVGHAPRLRACAARVAGNSSGLRLHGRPCCFSEADAGPVLAAERRLLERAELVLFSSATLAERVRSRAAVRRFEVVNNGVADSLLQREALPPRASTARDGPVLGYFGTISHWFDWPLVLQLLDAMPTARLRSPVLSRLRCPAPTRTLCRHRVARRTR